MPHGQPDGGAYSVKETVASDADNAEQAARLGSIVTFDRRGDVVLLDNFEDNINKWAITLIGTGARIGLSSKTARNGGLCCELVTGDTTGNESEMSRFLSYPVLSKMGLEISMSLHSFVSPVIMYLHLEDGTTWTLGGLRYTPNTNTLDYFDSGGGWTPITTTLPLYLALQCFHTFKLVIDPATGRYVRAIVGPHLYDLSAHALRVAGHVLHNFLGVTFNVTARRDANESMFIADLIMTQNEP